MNENEKVIEEKETIKKSCFVVTPIGKETDSIRRHVDGIIKAVIEPVLRKYDYEIYVPHKMSMPGSIDKQIIKKLYQCELVIVNLTNVNPNVMYELALRHCFGTPLIIIAENGTELPFDIGNQRTIFYHNDAMGVLTLEEDLSKAIQEILDEPYESPVISVIKELGIEEIIIKDKTINSNTDEANAWSLLFEKLDRMEQRINPPSQKNVTNLVSTLPHHEIELLISGEQKISYRVRDSLRLLLNSMKIDYIMERSFDDTKMSVRMERVPSLNWKFFVNTITDICKSNNVTIEIIE